MTGLLHLLQNRHADPPSLCEQHRPNINTALLGETKSSTQEDFRIRAQRGKVKEVQEIS